MPTVPQPPQAVRTEKSLSRFRKSRGSFFASGYTSLDGLFRLCRMVIKQARKRDLLTQLLQDGGAGKFKAIAEAHGLTCVPCGQYGWNTTPGDNLVEYALSKGWNEIRIGRSSFPPFFHSGAVGTAQGGAGTTPGGKRPSSTRKLICPRCGQSVRATKKVNILCGDCMLPMAEV